MGRSTGFGGGQAAATQIFGLEIKVVLQLPIDIAMVHLGRQSTLFPSLEGRRSTQFVPGGRLQRRGSVLLLAAPKYNPVPAESSISVGKAADHMLSLLKPPVLLV